jgi:CRP/FNR family transcriptional regulator, cyclic AMP receptor protein
MNEAGRIAHGRRHPPVHHCLQCWGHRVAAADFNIRAVFRLHYVIGGERHVIVMKVGCVNFWVLGQQGFPDAGDLGHLPIAGRGIDDLHIRIFLHDLPETVRLASALRVLGAQGWFSQRSKATRARLSGIAKLRTFSKDEVIYLVGDAPNGVFGLVSGSLNVSFPRNDGEDYTLHRSGSGFWIGDLALFSSGIRLVSVRAAEPTLMVHLPVHDLAKLLRSAPRLYADFYALTYENFRTALRIISNLAVTSTEKRLADRLIMEVETRGDGDDWISMSQPVLAKLVATSVPTLQRVTTCQRRVCEKQLCPGPDIGSDALTRLCKS